MGFQITGLSPDPFRHRFGLSEEKLKQFGAIRIYADSTRDLTDRVEMRNASPGESVLLINHECQPANTPYKASHAIFVLEHATHAFQGEENEVPEIMQIYLQSLRAFDKTGMMVEADVAFGADVKPTIERLLANPQTAYIHAHNAKQGCYAGRIDRV